MSSKFTPQDANSANKSSGMAGQVPTPANARLGQDVPKMLDEEGAIGKQFTEKGALGGMAQKVGGPFDKEGAIGKQFTTEGALGGTVQDKAGGTKKRSN